MKLTQDAKNTWRRKNVPTSPTSTPKNLCAFAVLSSDFLFFCEDFSESFSQRTSFQSLWLCVLCALRDLCVILEAIQIWLGPRRAKPSRLCVKSQTIVPKHALCGSNIETPPLTENGDAVLCGSYAVLCEPYPVPSGLKAVPSESNPAPSELIQTHRIHPQSTFQSHEPWTPTFHDFNARKDPAKTYRTEGHNALTAKARMINPESRFTFRIQPSVTRDRK